MRKNKIQRAKSQKIKNKKQGELSFLNRGYIFYIIIQIVILVLKNIECRYFETYSMELNVLSTPESFLFYNGMELSFYSSDQKENVECDDNFFWGENLLFYIRMK